MFIAHAPSGYLLSVALLRRLEDVPSSPTALIAACVLGAVAPDVDLAYFYFIDHRQTLHHHYFTHWPLFWLALTALSGATWAALSRLQLDPKAAFLTVVFCLGALLHMALDTVAGYVLWLAPFLDTPWAMVKVPALYSHWWLNFVLHWTFLLEIAICLWSWCVFQQRRVSARARLASGT